MRGFGTWFYQLKSSAYSRDIAASNDHPSAWEKKGNEIFTHGRVYKTKRLGFALINEIKKRGGKVFYHGLEKRPGVDGADATTLYCKVLSGALRSIEAALARLGENYLVILDEHQSRVDLLAAAMRTMYGHNSPARHLIEPPYQVESHLYQTIQAADWISSIVGPMWAYKALPQQFADREWAQRYFSDRIGTAQTHSSVALRIERQPAFRLAASGPDAA